jgi:hypothetical protein
MYQRMCHSYDFFFKYYICGIFLLRLSGSLFVYFCYVQSIICNPVRVSRVEHVFRISRTAVISPNCLYVVYMPCQNFGLFALCILVNLINAAIFSYLSLCKWGFIMFRIVFCVRKATFSPVCDSPYFLSGTPCYHRRGSDV